jgi:zinc protease
MNRSRRLLGSWIGLGLLTSCAPLLPPLHVPGPTTAHPAGYSVEPAAAPPPSNTPIQTVTLPSPGANVVTFRVAFASGSADDPVGKEGLTRLAATTMTEGGTVDLTYEQLVAQLYPLAASIDVHVDRDETVFTGEVSVAALAAFYPLFRQVLLTPRLDEAGFDRQRARAVSALTDDLRGSNDEQLGKEALEALIYEGHPYGHPVLGTERGLASSSLADAKAQRDRVFCRDRVTVGLAGGLPDGFAASVAHDLEALPPCSVGRAALPAPHAQHGLRVLIVDKPSADATAISMGNAYDLTRSSADYPAVAFFTDYLGLHRQSSGRLFQELREKRGLNYGDYAYAEHFEQEGGGRFPLPNVARRQELFSIWLRPVKSANAPFALRAALREYALLLEHSVSPSEIVRYRDFLTRYGALEELTPARRLGYAMDDLTYGLHRPYLETLRNAWQALDEPSLAAATKRHLSANDLTIVIVTHDGPAVAASLLSASPAKAPTYESPKPADVTAADGEIARFPVAVTKDNVRVVPVGELFKE